MKKILFLVLIFKSFTVANCLGQYNVTRLENNAYKITVENFHDYFDGYTIISKQNKVVKTVNTRQFTDSVNFKLTPDKHIQIIEIKSKNVKSIPHFKSSLADGYTIYDEESMKLYFNEKKQISLNFYVLNSYSIIEIFLNERLTLEE